MPTKLQFYTEVAERTLNNLTTHHTNWTDFLNTAARLYKYPFHDQLMIYAQRSNAVACAELEFWNEQFNRWVRRGAKGIALIDDSWNYPRLKYVFDVADTEPSHENSRPVKLWEMLPEHELHIITEFAKNYEDVSNDDSLVNTFGNIATQLASEYYSDNENAILAQSEYNPYDDYSDNESFKAAFEEALALSVAYTVMVRCGIDPYEYINERDIREITAFNTPETINALGVATSSLSEQVLRDIEITVRKYERVKNTERSENDYDRNPYLQPNRGLSAARPETQRTAEGTGGTTRQIRTDEESVPQGLQGDNVQQVTSHGAVIPTSEGDGTDSDGEDVADNERIDGTEPAARQSDQPDGVDSGDELDESAGGGNDTERVNLQLNENDAPSDEGGVSLSAETRNDTFSQLGKSSIEEILRRSVISLDEVDAILRDGGNYENHYLSDMPFQSRSSLRIAAYFSKGLDDNVSYLKREYLTGRYGNNITESGKGFDFGKHRVCTWFTADGIELAIGATAKNNIHRVVIPWEDAAARIAELMRDGQYISREAFDNALDNDRRELADRLHSFYRDYKGYSGMPDEWKAEKDGVPGDEALIKSLLDNEDERKTILKRLESDIDEWSNSIEKPRIWQNPFRLLEEMNNAMHPSVISPNDDYVPERKFSYFITQDEIDSLLTRGGTYNHGKLRILSFFLRDHDEKEKLAFIKREYGNGGGTWCQTDGWQSSEPGKGLRIERGRAGNPDANVNLKWNAVIKRTEQLINEGQYMTRAELDYIPNYERLMLVRKVEHFYYNLPDEYERPFNTKTWQNYTNTSREEMEQLLDFNYPREAEWQAIRGFLDNTERVDELLKQMQHIFENTSTDDRYYSTRKAGYEALLSYKNGTYTLFSGIENLPDPETVKARLEARRISRPAKPQSEMIEDMREQTVVVQDVEQLSFFDVIQPPVLPSVDEQRTRIEQSLQDKAEKIIKEAEVEENTPALYLPTALDTLLLGTSDENKIRITTQFTDNPRSREAVALVRDIYGELNGITIQNTIKRISELIADGSFVIKNGKEHQSAEESLSSDTASYKLRDTFYMDDGKPYVIQWIGPHEISYFSPDTPYIRKLIEREVFEDLLWNVPLNEHLLPQDPRFTEITDPAIIAEVDAIFGINEPQTTAHKLHSEPSSSGEGLTDYYLVIPPDGENASLTHETLSLIKEKADSYVICAELCYLSDEEMENWSISFRKMPRDWELLPEAVKDKVNEIKPLYEAQWRDSFNISPLGMQIFHELYLRGFAVSDELIVDGVSDYYASGDRGDFLEIVDFIVTEYLSDPEHEDDTLLPITSLLEPQKQIKGIDYRITDLNLGEGGPKTKFRNNITALQTLKDLENSNIPATPEQQEILARYVGWGGIQQAFDPDNKDWAKEYQELKDLLTQGEWESARATVLNAHYTSPTVIKAIYDTVERLGFRYGNILEPSCGVGNFLGMLPESMQGSKLYGVELDGVTARIARQLYPNADIRQMGYEETDFSDAFFDIAIGNVPFGTYGVIDNRYKTDFRIHDYFFQKTIDKVRPGGIIAFVTTKGTLDKQNPEVRKYIAQRAELLGAVRLPNNAFLKNAGTEATTDIIFLQKRDRPIDIEPDWVHLGITESGLPLNRYFLDNPEMLLGTMSNDAGTRMYGSETNTTCVPIDGANLADQLDIALSFIEGQYTVDELDDLEGVDNHAIPADPNVKNFSYTDVDGTVYFRENSMMYPVDLPAMTLSRITGMIGLRECVQKLIALQLDDHSDAEIKAQQAKLSILYDSFIAEYGLISSQANSRAFNADSAYYLLSSLEVLDENGELERKADMFTTRTIRQRSVITHVDTASEALAVSLGEKARVDIGFMAQLTGFTIERLVKDLEGVIFYDIGNPNNALPPYSPDKMQLHEKFPLVTADEYLSGNVRDKLSKAERFVEVSGDELNGVDITVNVEALRAIQPKDLEAGEIAVRLGSTWIDADYIQEFMYELLDVMYYNKNTYQVKYHEYTGEWQVTGKGRAQYSDIPATVTYGTTRMNAYQILDDSLNLRDVRVYDIKEDAEGKERRVLNKKETMLAQQKQELIKQKFRDWIWSDPERRQTLVKKYNELFNSVRPRDYDGSHIVFSGMNPEIKLSTHQIDGAARQIYGGNTLYAHVVGAGKTFTMIASAMESKRLGLCQKNLFAVPNHLTEQWAAEFMRLYPSANILVATKKDFEMRNRKKFCAKIATGDYDAVIIGHTQLEKIPMSRERQERLLRDQIDEIEDGLIELKASKGERFSIKQLEKTRKSLELRLAKLLDSKRRDDVVTYEQLGVDRLYVDEAHNFKNLFLYTKMRNVAGLSTSEAQKSSDLYMKCRFMDERTGNKGVIFATGTPISNSMSEMYTMQRYLQTDALKDKRLTHFDAWASTFGETVTSIELAPEGTGYRARTRFAKFHNLPELMSMFKEVADIQTADMLNLPVPDAKYENIIVEPSELQQEMVEELSERARLVHARMVEPNVDNMLKITTDGRKIGLDQRLMNPILPDHEGSKVNACTDKVFEIWSDTRNDRLTQLVFCDFSTPNKDGRFNVYDDIKEKLLERGIPEHEIAFIHDADTETRKKELFARVRQGKVRVLFGSTFKMGAGTNVQDRLVAIHDADCPWRPADLEQRSGRIIRQGNMNPEVQIFRYATSGTFDSYLWQTVQKKQEFISQIISSKSPVRSCEDVDETALSYAEIKALCAGNPLIAEKMSLDNEVAKLRMLKAEHKSQHYRLEDDLLKRLPEQVASTKERIEGILKDIAAYNKMKEPLLETKFSTTQSATTSMRFPGMLVNDVMHYEKEPAAKALLEACKSIKGSKTELPIGEYMGFKMSLQYEMFGQQVNLLLRDTMTYKVDLGDDALGNITRINNALDKLPERLGGAQSQLANLNRQTEAAKLELAKPFEQESELQEKELRLAFLNAELNIDGESALDVLSNAGQHDSDDFVARVADALDDMGVEYSRPGIPSDESSDYDDYSDEFEHTSSRVAQSVVAKTKPSILNGIRSFDSNKHNAVNEREKSAERGI